MATKPPSPFALNGELLAAPSAQAVRFVVAANVGSFNLINCSTAAHKLAVFSARAGPAGAGNASGGIPPELCARAAEVIVADLTGAPARNLANLIWAMAKCEAYHPRLERAIVAAARGKFASGDFKPQELSNAAWALARLCSQQPGRGGKKGGEAEGAEPAADDALLLELAGALGKALHASVPQAIANGAWAFATLVGAGRLGGPSPEKASASLAGAGYAPSLLAATAAARAREFNAQELANTAWAVGKLAVASSVGVSGGGAASAYGALADAVLAAIESRPPSEFADQQLANALWGCARLALAARGAQAQDGATGGETRSERLRRVAAANCAPRLGRFRPVELCMAAWAYVTALTGVAYAGAIDQDADDDVQVYISNIYLSIYMSIYTHTNTHTYVYTYNIYMCKLNMNNMINFFRSLM
ncbi:hypothetical protein T492DRAFT_63526 [Pavlovales sp. CCMP2436]|nr:hypothetical protein T492DRAFT_63526 [Pavlovales sp. CCMP2436]